MVHEAEARSTPVQSALHFEPLVLILVRTGNFALYVDSLTKLAPWFFILDHTNYARWVPVHIRDMANLHRTHPETAAEFDNGNFTVRKTVCQGLLCHGH